MFLVSFKSFNYHASNTVRVVIVQGAWRGKTKKECFLPQTEQSILLFGGSRVCVLAEEGGMIFSESINLKLQNIMYHG